jgi:hypothetical protein
MALDFRAWPMLSKLNPNLSGRVAVSAFLPQPSCLGQKLFWKDTGEPVKLDLFFAPAPFDAQYARLARKY